MLGRLEGRIALVTGGGSGIGAATALALAAEGAAAVVIAGRRVKEGEKVAEAVERAGAQGRFVQTGVTDPAQQEALVEAVMTEFGRLHIAFNNAGYQEPRAMLAEQDDATYCRVFDTNVRAVFHGMRSQIRAMLASGGGAIINNASVSGLRNPNAGLSLYSASKAAVVSLTRSAALEYAGQGIRVNAVAPGRVVTDMMLRSGIADMSVVAAGLPLKRMGTAEEVAEAVVWLASDSSAYVVGHILCTDGGFMAG
jgi:NAD(P)-dependent dehydrogenase (short-subunit alcohol dehydrogenase family)